LDLLQKDDRPVLRGHRLPGNVPGFLLLQWRGLEGDIFLVEKGSPHRNFQSRNNRRGRKRFLVLPAGLGDLKWSF